MKSASLRTITLLEVIGLPAFTLVFIWRPQFTAPYSWIGFLVWIAASFLIHQDTPKSLGWRADNLWPAGKWALLAFFLFGGVLIVVGAVLGQPFRVPPNLRSLDRLWTYFAFCVLQQVVLNSYLTNRLLALLRKDWAAALAAGAIFSACHWPNPVLVPLTFAGGAAMAWLFARDRNIIPLAVFQAVIGSLAWWSFPVAWHHHLRVGQRIISIGSKNPQGHSAAFDAGIQESGVSSAQSLRNHTWDKCWLDGDQFNRTINCSALIDNSVLVAEERKPALFVLLLM